MTSENLSHAPSQYQTNLFHRVLVAEDNDVIRRVNAGVLIRSGYEVSVAEDGVAAWAELQSNNYDLLVTDNDMPKLSGLELLKKLHAARMALPVVLASGTIPDEEELKEYPWLKLDAALPKPFTTAELLDTVRKVIFATDGTAARTPPSDWRDQPVAAGTKISVQNSQTGKFMRCDSVWTVDINEALNFLSVRRAVSFGMNELQDPFQILQIENDNLPGTVIITISNLPRSPQFSCKGQRAASQFSLNISAARARI